MVLIILMKGSDNCLLQEVFPDWLETVNQSDLPRDFLKMTKELEPVNSLGGKWVSYR
jgi:hypothetical protein